MQVLIPQSSVMFFKISIVNKSQLRASNCTIEKIEGSLLYVSGSNLIIDGNTTMQDLSSAETEAELFMIDTSTVTISDAIFRRLYQLYVTPVFRLQESTFQLMRGSFTDFDKTLFFLEGGSYTFDSLNITHGRMTWAAGIDPYMVNSIVFDVSAADLTLQHASFQGIFSNFSSPIIYIENDPTATDKTSLNLLNSHFV